METIILRTRDQFDDLTLKNIKINDQVTFISGLEKDTQKRLLQCIGFDGWNKMQAQLWFSGFRSHADKVANLPDEAAGIWLQLYDEMILAGNDSDTAADKAWAEIKKKWIEDGQGHWHKYKAIWEDELTTSQNPVIEVFRAGDYPQGKITTDDIDKMVANYNTAIYKAPITIDHSQKGPAQGWVNRIFRMGDSLYAVLENLVTDFVKKVRSKEYINRSIEIDEIEYDGKYIWPYFTAVTFLGSGQPQVKGMAEPVFVHSRSDHLMGMAFSMDRPGLIGFPVDVTEDSIRIRQKDPGLFEEGSFRTITLKGVSGIQAVIGKLKGKDTTTIQTYIFDKSKWSLEKAKAWIKEHGGKYSQDQTLYEDKGGKLDKLEFTQEQLDSKLKAEREAGKAEGKNDREKEFSDLKTENKALKDQIAEGKKTTFEKHVQSEYDRLLKAKKLLPAQKDYFWAMMKQLSADETTKIKFSDGKEYSAAEAFIKDLEAGPDKIDTTDKTHSDDPNKKKLDTEVFQGTQFENAPEVSKKRMLFINKKLEEAKIKVGDAEYQAKYREFAKQAAKEILE